MANARIYWLHCLSPTHVGGDRGVGSIDQPVHRDKATNWPVIPGSAFQRAWADHYTAGDPQRREDPGLRLAFGLATEPIPSRLEGEAGGGGTIPDQAAASAGALIATDARLVCLPIRSFQGTFAWCTSALALRMLRRDLDLVGETDTPPDLTGPEAGTVLHARESVLIEGSKIYLEDLDFAAKEADLVDRWARWVAQRVFPDDSSWPDEFRRRFAVLPDVVFDFLTETGTEVTGRVRIRDETKVAAPGHLWNEEVLPAETILAGVITCERIPALDAGEITPDGLLANYAEKPLTLRIGGRATVGRGRVRCVFAAVSGGVP